MPYDLYISTNYKRLLSRHLGSVWIEFIVAETENWKHCSKIIFKCVKSTVGPIFNIFNTWTVLLSMWTVLLQCLNSNFYLYTVNLLFMRWKKKKKKKDRNSEMKMWKLVSAVNQTLTYRILISNNHQPHLFVTSGIMRWIQITTSYPISY